MIDRESLRSTAAYLRNVRPIDPEEVFEYVTDRPHPAVVREALREEAVDLDLVERPDGTFVPAPTGAVPPRREPATAFPEAYARVVEDALVERYGANWHRGDSGEELRGTIRRLKDDYYRGNPVEYDGTAALAYAVYHLPDYYAVVGAVLDPLAEAGLLPRRLRVLDVGAGSGGPAVGLHDYLFGAPTVDDDLDFLDADATEDTDADAAADADDAAGRAAKDVDAGAAGDEVPALVDYHAVEPSPAADLAERLFAETDRNFHATVHRERVENVGRDALGDEPFDLVLVANVLSELADPVAVVRDLLDLVADDGTLALVAPADLRTATTLREVERAIVDGTDRGADDARDGGDDEGDRSRERPTVFAPTLRLWPGAAPTDRGWSFDRRPDVEPPAFQRRLDAAGDGDGTFTNPTVKFAYALLRPDGRRRVDVRASPERHARFADSETHVTNRVDALAVKLSHDLSDGGDANPVIRVGDGSQSVDHYAVRTRPSALNRDLLDAPYGAVLAFEHVLVLWNDDEAAYNLVVDAETTVDRVG